MKISKRQLKRIIREEYSKLKKYGMIREWNDGSDVSGELLDLAARPEGISLDEIMDLFGDDGFKAVDEMAKERIVWLDDKEGVVYASGSRPSKGLYGAIKRYTANSQKLEDFDEDSALQRQAPQGLEDY